jgi:hypothetical protein
MPFLFYLMLRLLTRPLVGLRGGASSKDLEILALRHQLRILRRKTGPPKFTPLDRAVLAAASLSLQRSAWASFMVSPSTLLRWHRELVRRKWTYGRSIRMGRPRSMQRSGASSCGWPGRTIPSRWGDRVSLWRCVALP